jgi:hypothetical protein
VFSVYPTDNPIDWLDSDHVHVFTVGLCPLRGYISKSVGIRSGQLRVVAAAEARKQARKQLRNSRSTEEYKKSACEDLTCDLKTLCAL